MIEINRQKQNSERLFLQQTDLFAWQATRQYELVSTCFWLSHIPGEHLASFLKKIAASLTPDGLFFFADSRLARTSRAKDHEVDTGTSRRKLDNGREYQIVKIFHEPDKLSANSRKQASVLPLKPPRTISSTARPPTVKTAVTP